MNTVTATVVVVGAGTAGISTVGAVVEKGYQRIFWVDPEFEGGSMKYYDGIPSNTKAKNLAKYAKHLRLFDKYAEEHNTVNVFSGLDPQKETTLNKLNECLGRMTNIIRTDFIDRVTMVKGDMVQVVQLENGQYEVTTSSKQHPVLRAHLLFLCLGADLKSVPNQPHIPRLNAYDVMSEKKIENYDFSEQTIQIYGSSHSAVLCLRNLVNMKHPPKKIYHIMNKKGLLFAEYVGEFIRNDTIGLKGVASDFGRLYEQGKYKDTVVTQYTWDNIVNPDTTKVIQVIGFKPKEFPFTSKQGVSKYQTGQGFVFINGLKLPHLYLVGIISPQFFTDKQGLKMPAVGVDKFLCYVLQLLEAYQTLPDQ